MHPDRLIVRVYRHSDGLSTISDKPNTFAHQCAITNNSPRKALHGPVTYPNIFTTVTFNPQNPFLQTEIIHHLRDRLRQENNISTIGGRNPNVSSVYIGTGSVVRRQGKKLLHLANHPKVVSYYYILIL